jgi:hypothetical protein
MGGTVDTLDECVYAIHDLVHDDFRCNLVRQAEDRYHSELLRWCTVRCRLYLGGRGRCRITLFVPDSANSLLQVTPAMGFVREFQALSSVLPVLNQTNVLYRARTPSATKTAGYSSYLPF